MTESKKIWPYSAMIVIFSLFASLLIFFVSFNILNTVLPLETNNNYYTVTFKETGLPVNSTWSVTLNNMTESSNNNTITFVEVGNFTYNYTVSNLKGYTIEPSKGIFYLDENITIYIVFKND